MSAHSKDVGYWAGEAMRERARADAAEAELREARADLTAIKETTMEVVGAHSRAVAELAEVSEARTTAQLNIVELVENAQRMKQQVASLSAIRERAETVVLADQDEDGVSAARFILGDAAPSPESERQEFSKYMVAMGHWPALSVEGSETPPDG